MDPDRVYYFFAAKLPNKSKWLIIRKNIGTYIVNLGPGWLTHVLKLICYGIFIFRINQKGHIELNWENKHPIAKGEYDDI